MTEEDAPREGAATDPSESASEPGSPRGGSMVRLAGIAVIAALLFGAAYFVGGLRPVGTPEEETPQSEGGVGQPAVSTMDRIIAPEDLPGFETEDLTNAQRLWLYHRAHLEDCGCECGMTVAQCRVEDPTCPESPGRAVELVREAREAVPGG